MSEDMQKIIFSKNLNNYIQKSGKTQLEIATKIGVSPQTFNTWCKGIAIPRMGKVQALADYFHINKSDLIEDKSNQEEESYYTNPETQQLAQEIFDNPDLKILFDTTKDCSPEDMKKVISMVKAFKGEL
ncbi:XRE family transcriptional regulator [Eubacterium sp. AF15-50]|uniref:helix-turn-helix domain-containing protein n=1 Tax=unclassified Eubacterium (in: firmicutes) TaxID=2624479 RepID=UPI000E4C0742|nr:MULTISPECIES: helix-turn-helix transcriptional regulator [unclassified Eubacterium (in: firmicutes)]RHR72595.1 XRE family transcriptional regulator [Eubacterium sp. AF16-48]RHR77847.1 XRE family transcriptional regulator [Eubacterium sp. AF15-50]